MLITDNILVKSFMEWERTRRSVGRSLRTARILAVVGLTACLVSTCVVSAEGDNTSYTFYELGYESNIFMEQETVSIEFNSPYDRSGWTINIHLYNPLGCVGSIDLNLNKMELLDNEYTTGGDQWIKKEVPPGMIKRGDNKIIIGFPFVSCNTGTTLIDDSYIRSNNSEAEEDQDGFPVAEDLQLFKPNNTSERHNPTKNGPDLIVSRLTAVGARINVDAGYLSPLIETVSVDFAVTNIGNEDVKKYFTTKIYVLDTNSMEYINSSHLSAGESFFGSVSYAAPFAVLKVKPVIVFVDANNNVTELDEDNNVMKEFAAIGMG